MKKTIKNRYIGKFLGYVEFCNEKDKNKKGKFLFKCTKKCKHNSEPMK